MNVRTRSSLARFGLAVVLSLGLAWNAHAQVGTNLGLLNPDLASHAELVALPHMNAALAESIIAGRPFANMLEVDTLLGSLSEQQKAELYERIFLPLNLNNTTREEILLIPRAGARMAREFAEYAPYAGLPVFRREIGKYVDDEEVARLEQYVFVPIKLNTASDADILTIPGLGSRMLREFKEYRPYQAMAQFRREIGKYVDDDEVARLERYVTID